MTWRIIESSWSSFSVSPLEYNPWVYFSYTWSKFYLDLMGMPSETMPKAFLKPRCITSTASTYPQGLLPCHRGSLHWFDTIHFWQIYVGCYMSPTHLSVTGAERTIRVVSVLILIASKKKDWHLMWNFIINPLSFIIRWIKVNFILSSQYKIIIFSYHVNTMRRIC